MIVGVSDSKGGIYSQDGFDPAVLLSHKETHGTVVSLITALSDSEVLQYMNSTVMTQECPLYDVLLEAVCCNHKQMSACLVKCEMRGLYV